MNAANSTAIWFPAGSTTATRVTSQRLKAFPLDASKTPKAFLLKERTGCPPRRRNRGGRAHRRVAGGATLVGFRSVRDDGGVRESVRGSSRTDPGSPHTPPLEGGRTRRRDDHDRLSA